MRISLAFLLAFTLCLTDCQLLAQSCCDNDDETVLCYLSAADFCTIPDDFCTAYSLDGTFMANALREKLESPANFGPNGTLNCSLTLKELENVTSVQAIKDEACDIVFVPVVSVDPVTQENIISSTFIPLEILEAIREWSLECNNNLVVVTQAEAQLWGYTMENANINPNTPVSGSSLVSIFDGPFGSLTSFNQGGSFQGVFTGVPGTGVEILANDANGNPTVGLDLATNDIVVGDIGIFCSGGAGVVSPGAGIVNNNDILICNIFSLACQLAADAETSDQRIELCPDETATLPDGTVTATFGIYVDTLASWLGCDSIITTEVAANVILPTLLDRKGCEGDGYAVTVNGHLYNEASASGQELLLTPGGCDSLVQIALTFGPHSAATLQTTLCAGEAFPLSNGQFADTPGTWVDTLVAANGCDSVLTLDLSFYESDTTFFVEKLCPGEAVTVGDTSYSAGATFLLAVPNWVGCDSFLQTELVPHEAPSATIDSFAQVTQSLTTPFHNLIPAWYGIQWEPAPALSCNECPNPIVLPNEGITQFTLSLVDSVCTWPYPVAVEYLCNTYVPTAFSPNFDGFNDEFMAYSSGCPAQAFRLQVFERWGALVFESEDIKAGWDGQINGKPATQGVYVWLIQMKEYGQEKQRQGEVILLR